MTTDEELARLTRAVELSPGDGLLWRAVADRLEELGEAGPAEALRLVTELRRPGRVVRRATKEERLTALLAGGCRPFAVTRALALPGGVTLDLVLIPPGTFRMGSPVREPGHMDIESPTRVVTLTRAFWLGVHPVTQAQWKAVLRRNPSRFKGPTRPVERVAWGDCEAFCAALGRHAGRPARLPTEAEWEYACRAGTTTPFHFGRKISADLANFDASYYSASTVAGEYRQETLPVGSFPPNGFGVYGMHDNVCEWCADWHASNYYATAPATDPTGPEAGGLREVRGGSWYNSGAACRSASRWGVVARDTNDFVGCRVVMGLG